MGLQIVIQRLLAGDAEPGPEAALEVIDAGVDNFGIARADAGADGVLGLQHDHLPAGQGHAPGDRQADDPGADDKGINGVGHVDGHH